MGHMTDETMLLSPPRTRRPSVYRVATEVCAIVLVVLLFWWAFGDSRPRTMPKSFEIPLMTRGDYMFMEDPEKSKPLITFLAIGDWGGTLGKEKGDGGSCCVMYNGSVDTRTDRYKVDFYAQTYVAELLAQSAKELNPSRILSHGDNFYWVGVGMDDAAYRLEQTFEHVYNQKSLKNIPWLNVAGNHDIGGANFICGDKEPYWECRSPEEIIKRFEAQSTYKSPHGDRWVLRDHYYLERVIKDDFVVEVYNIDTNYAENHGSQSVCCQCYGYAAKYNFSAGVCESVGRGHRGCANGSVELYDACMHRIDSWAEDSYKQALNDLSASDADFKIINTHFSPHYHMNEAKMLKWFELCELTGVTAWFNGHTHGFNHDISSWGTHFFMNGGGGGYFTANSPIVTNEQIQNQWLVAGQPYGIMELSFSRDWLKVQFATFDDKWVYGGFNLTDAVIGGVARGHCWFIPRANAEVYPIGLECNSSYDGPIGAPLHWR
ncbi:calcineurin-like phosphoesterase [Thraustotheca clavata]|uniref:Calcineurin-like phosphoesterase n=1 Tax=Thraustotheca clavata TaxID=74557 RepID=A0A1V9YVK2_9STRA|nr:calcineurin-like phosphoesterase [Thraustotheca clavata]